MLELCSEKNTPELFYNYSGTWWDSSSTAAAVFFFFFYFFFSPNSNMSFLDVVYFSQVSSKFVWLFISLFPSSIRCQAVNPWAWLMECSVSPTQPGTLHPPLRDSSVRPRINPSAGNPLISLPCPPQRLPSFSSVSRWLTEQSWVTKVVKSRQIFVLFHCPTLQKVMIWIREKMQNIEPKPENQSSLHLL